jgi:hypothetical protein
LTNKTGGDRVSEERAGGTDRVPEYFGKHCRSACCFQRAVLRYIKYIRRIRALTNVVSAGINSSYQTKDLSHVGFGVLEPDNYSFKELCMNALQKIFCALVLGVGAVSWAKESSGSDAITQPEDSTFFVDKTVSPEPPRRTWVYARSEHFLVTYVLRTSPASFKVFAPELHYFRSIAYGDRNLSKSELFKIVALKEGTSRTQAFQDLAEKTRLDSKIPFHRVKGHSKWTNRAFEKGVYWNLTPNGEFAYTRDIYEYR